MFFVRDILDKKVVNRKKLYLVWWRGYPKSEATWEPEKQLKDDGFAYLIDEFENKFVFNQPITEIKQ